MHLKLIESLISSIESNLDTNNTKHKQRVLYIFPLKRDYAAVKSLPKSMHDKYDFHFIDSKYFSYSSKASSEFSMIEFIQKCIDTVKKLQIDIVLSTRDMADLVHAVLANEFKHIKGPNYISSFITLYKPYTKLFIDIDDPINYEIINIKNNKWLNIVKNPESSDTKQIIQSLLNKLNGKGFIKPPAASCSSLIGDFSDIDHFQSLLTMHSKHGKVFNHYLPEFVDKYITQNPYKIITNDIKQKMFTSSEISNILLIEEFVDTPIKVTVDGCVINKKIYIWGVIDSIYWNNIGKNECFVGCFMPSNLSNEICNELIKKYKIYVNRLMDNYGFNDQFIDIEFFVIPRNKKDLIKCMKNVLNWKDLKKDQVDLKLMEINGRSFMQMTPIYRQVFNDYDGDTICTLLKMYDNNKRLKFKQPKLLSNVCGLNGYLPTFESGIADDLFDFDAAEKYIKNGIVILAVQKGEIVNTVSQQGSLLAYANIIGKNYKQCFQKMIEIGMELIKKGAPWQINSEH